MPKSGNFSPAFLGSLTPATTVARRAICVSQTFDTRGTVRDARGFASIT